MQITNKEKVFFKFCAIVLLSHQNFPIFLKLGYGFRKDMKTFQKINQT